MKVRDPIALLQLRVPPVGLPTITEIRLAERRLLAAFAHSGRVTIPLNGREYGRSAVLWAARTLSDPQALAHWVALHRQPALLAFVHDPRPQGIPSIAALMKEPDEGFRYFLSVLMGRILKIMVDEAVRDTQWESLQHLLKQMDWVAVWDPKHVLSSIARHLKQLILDLMELGKMDRAALTQRWAPTAYPPAMWDAIKALPKDMDPLRNRLVRAMVAAAKHFAFELGEEAAARILIDRVVRLDLSAEVTKDVAAIRRYLFRTQSSLLAEIEGRMTRSDAVMGMVQLTGIFLMLLIMMRRCGA